MPAKATPQRRRRQAQPQPQQAAAAAFGGTMGGSVGAFVVRPGDSRHGPLPRWGRREYAIAAIGALYPDGVPKTVKDLALWRKVQERLSADPKFRAAGYTKISRQTVARARRKYHAAND
jgi:hypothetical protein